MGNEESPSQAVPAPVPDPGDAAPDVALQDTEGEVGQLSVLWERAPRGLVLIFLRHFG